jgi:hypothetical protein
MAQPRAELNAIVAAAQEATVLQLPAQPTTAAEANAQTHIAYVD